MPRTQWIIFTAVGLTAGVFSALVLGDPIEAVFGMLLVTPVLTAIVGVFLGAAQWVHVRDRLGGLGSAWIIGTCLGLGVGLAAGVVLVEQGGRLLVGQPVRLLELGPFGRAASFGALGAVSGWLLGLGQWIVVRGERAFRGWPTRNAIALAIGFPVSSLIVDLAVGGLGTPLGVAVFLFISGSILGAHTGRSLRHAA